MKTINRNKPSPRKIQADRNDFYPQPTEQETEFEFFGQKLPVMLDTSIEPNPSSLPIQNARDPNPARLTDGQAGTRPPAGLSAEQVEDYLTELREHDGANCGRAPECLRVTLDNDPEHDSDQCNIADVNNIPADHENNGSTCYEQR